MLNVLDLTQYRESNSGLRSERSHHQAITTCSILINYKNATFSDFQVLNMILFSIQLADIIVFDILKQVTDLVWLRVRLKSAMPITGLASPRLISIPYTFNIFFGWGSMYRGCLTSNISNFIYHLVRKGLKYSLDDNSLLKCNWNGCNRHSQPKVMRFLQRLFQGKSSAELTSIHKNLLDNSNLCNPITNTHYFGSLKRV